MTRKKSKQSEEKIRKPRKKAQEKSSLDSQKKDSNAAPEGVKFRVTFLVAQSFRGGYYKAGESIEVPEGTAKAYARRSTLKIEPL